MRRLPCRPTCIGFALAAALSAAAGARGAEADPGTVQRTLAGQLRLTRGLLDALARAHPGENVIVSPASVAGMLAAVDLGAGPAMHQSILNVLGIAPGPAAEGDLAALREAAARTTADGDLSIATRVVFDEALHPTAAGLGRLSAAGVEGDVMDLHTSSAVADINTWAARATQGKIPGIIDRIAPDEEMIALNAVYFSGRWSEPFKVSDTRPGDFTTASGRRIRVPFMHAKTELLDVRQDDRFVAVNLPFQDGRFWMTAVTTRAAAGKVSDFADHLGWLDGQGFNAPVPVAIDMPRFDANTKQSLSSMLEAMGLDGRQPFSGFAKRYLYVSDIVQAVDLNVDEEGAKVAAVTAGEFTVQGGVVYRNILDIAFDKPFAFAIRDARTGLMLATGFVGAVEGSVLADGSAPVPARSPFVPDPLEAAAEERARRMAGPRPAEATPTIPVPEKPRSPQRLRLERDF